MSTDLNMLQIAVRIFSNGTILRNNVFRYLFSVGYRTEDIYAVLDEMEWKDE